MPVQNARTKFFKFLDDTRPTSHAPHQIKDIVISCVKSTSMDSIVQLFNVMERHSFNPHSVRSMPIYPIAPITIFQFLISNAI